MASLPRMYKRSFVCCKSLCHFVDLFHQNHGQGWCCGLCRLESQHVSAFPERRYHQAHAEADKASVIALQCMGCNLPRVQDLGGAVGLPEESGAASEAQLQGVPCKLCQAGHVVLVCQQVHFYGGLVLLLGDELWKRQTQNRQEKSVIVHIRLSYHKNMLQQPQ